MVMFDQLDDPSPPVPGPHERGQVMSRAEQLIGRRRLLTGLGVAVAIAMLALVVGIVRNDGSGGDLRTAAGAAKTNSTDDANAGTTPAAGESPTTAGVSVLGTQITSTTTTVAAQPGAQAVIISAPQQNAAGPGPGPAPARATTTSLVCRNSTNPACGDFSWDPPPGENKPIAWQLTFSPPNPRVGEKVTFHLMATDPDGGKPLTCNYSFDTSKETVVCERYMNTPCPTRYGPWTPPARKEGSLDELVDHTYDKSGVYDVFFQVDNGRDCDSPYASGATLTARVNVADASPVPAAPTGP